MSAKDSGRSPHFTTFRGRRSACFGYWDRGRPTSADRASFGLGPRSPHEGAPLSHARTLLSSTGSRAGQRARGFVEHCVPVLKLALVIAYGPDRFRVNVGQSLGDLLGGQRVVAGDGCGLCVHVTQLVEHRQP